MIITNNCQFKAYFYQASNLILEQRWLRNSKPIKHASGIREHLVKIFSSKLKPKLIFIRRVASGVRLRIFCLLLGPILEQRWLRNSKPIKHASGIREHLVKIFSSKLKSLLSANVVLLVLSYGGSGCITAITTTASASYAGRNARPPGMRTVAGSILTSGKTFFHWDLVIKKNLRPFSPFRWSRRAVSSYWRKRMCTKYWYTA